MKRYLWLVVVLALLVPGGAHAQTKNRFGVTISGVGDSLLNVISPGPTQPFHWAHDSWWTQDKLFDHFSFAFVLGQLTEDVFQPRCDGDRAVAILVNAAPWVIKELIDGKHAEGASPKDFTASVLGLGLALLVH